MANEFVNKPSSLEIPIGTLAETGFTAEGLKRIDVFLHQRLRRKEFLVVSLVLLEMENLCI